MLCTAMRPHFLPPSAPPVHSVPAWVGRGREGGHREAGGHVWFCSRLHPRSWRQSVLNPCLWTDCTRKNRQLDGPHPVWTRPMCECRTRAVTRSFPGTDLSGPGHQLSDSWAPEASHHTLGGLETRKFILSLSKTKVSQGRTPSEGSSGEPSRLARFWQLLALLGSWPHHPHRCPVATGRLLCARVSPLLPFGRTILAGCRAPQRIQVACLQVLKLVCSASFSKAGHIHGSGVRKRTYIWGGHPPLTPPQSSKHLNAKSDVLHLGVIGFEKTTFRFVI